MGDIPDKFNENLDKTKELLKEIRRAAKDWAPDSNKFTNTEIVELISSMAPEHTMLIKRNDDGTFSILRSDVFTAHKDLSMRKLTDIEFPDGLDGD